MPVDDWDWMIGSLPDGRYNNIQFSTCKSIFIYCIISDIEIKIRITNYAITQFYLK